MGVTYHCFVFLFGFGMCVCSPFSSLVIEGIAAAFVLFFIFFLITKKFY